MRAYENSHHASLWNLLFDLEQDLDRWRTRPLELEPDSQSCLLLDIFKGSDLAVELRRRWLGTCGTEVLETLRDPPREVCGQVLVWHISEAEIISPRLTDALGLELEISPQYFQALYLLVKGQPPEDRLRGHETELRPLRSDFVVMSNAIIFIGRNRHSERDSVPVVLVAGNFCADQELWDAPPLQPATMETLPRVEGVYIYKPVQRYISVNDGAARRTRTINLRARANSWIVTYSELLDEFLRRDVLREMTGDALSFTVLLALMQLDILWIRQSCRLLRRTLADTGSMADAHITRIQEHRQSLRRSVEDAEDSLDHLKRYIDWQRNYEWLQNPVYVFLKQQVEQQVEQCCVQARRLEVEARDSLQLEAGLLALQETRLSLQESRRSIKLSNQQIQEGKRGKMSHDKKSCSLD